MKYCTHCGKELLDEAVICPGCGCATNYKNTKTVDDKELLNTLSQRINTNGIIWLVIGILQILGGIFLNWFLLIVGVLNLVSSIQGMKYSKVLLENPTGIVAKYEPLTGPVITLIYNLVIGGVIGVIGSIYYFVAIRSFVMENKQFFASLDAPATPIAKNTYDVTTSGKAVKSTPVAKNTYDGTTSVKAVKSTTLPDGRWICNYCATENSANYGQCKKCGKFRSS